MSKKKRAMSYVSLALGVLLAVVVVAYLSLRTDFFARAAGRLVTKHLFGDAPFTVSLDKLEGSIVRDVTMRNIRISYRGGDVAAFEMFRAEEVTCRYSIASLLGANHLVDEIIVMNPVFRLVADSTGEYVLPSLGTGGFSTYGIERLSIHHGSLLVRGVGTAVGVNDVNIAGSIHSGPEGVSVRFARGSASESSRQFVVRSLTGGFGYTRVPSPGAGGDAMSTKYVIDSLAVSLEQSSLVLDGSVVGDERMLDIGVRAAPADIDEIARIAGTRTEGWGEIVGSFTLNGRPDRLEVRGVAEGAIAGYALERFRFNVLREGSTISFDGIDGTLNGTRLLGRGTARLGEPRTLELSLEVERLDISRGFIRDMELPESDLTGAVTVACRFDPFAATFGLDLDAGSFRGAPFDEARIQGSYGSDTLRFSEIDMTHAGHRVSARGTIAHGRDVFFVMNMDIDSASPLFAYFDIEEYRADAALNALMEGTFDEFDLRMSGDVQNLGYHGTHLADGELKLAVEKRAGYRVLCDVDGSVYQAGPFAFDTLSLSLEYDEELSRIKKLYLAGSDISVSATADISDEGQETRIALADCEIDALGASWIVGGDRAIVIAGDVIRFEDLQFHSREGAVFADCIWHRGRETLDGSIRVDRLNIGVLRGAGVATPPIEGRARGTLLCEGPISDPSLRARFEIDGGRIDTFSIDAALFDVSYEPGRFRIDSLTIRSPSGGLILSGDISGVSIRDVARRGGGATERAVVALDAVCSDLKAAPFFSLARVPGMTAGRLDGVLTVRDTLAHPVVTFEGVVRGLARESFSVPEIICELRLDRRSLEMNGELVLSNKHRGAFRGSLPVTAAPFLYSLDRSRGLALVVEIPDGDFAEVPSLTNRVAEATGRYAAAFSVSGTIDDPHIAGEARIRDASLRIGGTEERLTALNASVSIEDSLITISRFDARRGKKGSATAGGTISLDGWRPGAYDLQARLSKFTVESFADIIAVLSGDLRVTTAFVDGRAVPNVTGACTVERADIFYDMSAIGSGGGGTSGGTPSFLAAVDLHIPGDTRVRTDDAQIELRGDVTLYHDRGGTYFRGDIDLVRGWYNLYNNKFNMRTGNIQFIVAGSSRPAVDIEAETRDPEGRRIYLTIRWHQDDQEPRLTLAHEDPGYSETDIWVMLGGGIVDAEGNGGASWDPRGAAQGFATNYLERVLNAQMQGVTIELESPASAAGQDGAADWTDTKIAVGKYLSEGLYVKYKQTLSISTAREFEVEYRLSDLILLRSQLIRYSEQVLSGKSSSTSDELNLDIKLRWEF